MIDQNLCRAELSPADRARQMARRKAIYEELNGPAKAIGAHAANAAMGNENANAKLADAFSADTARLTGQSERTVQRDAERGEKVIEEALVMVRGTKLDTGTLFNGIDWPARGRGAWDVAPASAAPFWGPSHIL